MKDPRDELIEAQREYIKFLENDIDITPLDDPEYIRDYASLKSKIETAEQALTQSGGTASNKLKDCEAVK